MTLIDERYQAKDASLLLLPVLQSAAWPGLADGARAHVWLGTPVEPSVLVAYAWLADDETLTYVTADNDPTEHRDDLVKEAFRNLEYYHTDFEVVEAGSGRMVVSAGWPFAAERVMCENHMLLAHEKLEAETIVVSIARRGAVIACAANCPAEVRHTMYSLHAEAWDDPDAVTERVTDELVVFNNGIMTGSTPIVLDDGGRPVWGPGRG
ncbi:MAG: hypothetical protein ACFCVK_03415 [Acidimicrobiales bacterium]